MVLESSVTLHGGDWAGSAGSIGELHLELLESIASSLHQIFPAYLGWAILSMTAKAQTAYPVGIKRVFTNR